MDIDTVIVFGDSLSDIGKKWVTKSGRLARATNQMYVSPSGRFSDCRNWTDFMFEQATGLTMITSTAQSTIDLSSRHTSLSAKSKLPSTVPKSFQYANYAEGGACGDTPASKGPFLGTFKDQVDAFESDCNTLQVNLGNTLFIVWFGANDLYTAECKAVEMAKVATQVASTQRNRLKTLAGQYQGTAKFVFVNLARPLTSVRYSMRLKTAEAELRRLLPPDEIQMLEGVGRFKSQMWHAQSALKYCDESSGNWQKVKAYQALIAQVANIKELEQGVLNFNLTLALIAGKNGDQVVEIGSCLSEETLLGLINGNYRLKGGAAKTTATHQSAINYSASSSVGNLTTIDEVHPTDQLYRVIWLEIYEGIKKAGCTFGKLTDVSSSSPLSTLGGPTQAARSNFDRVMRELAAKH